LSCTRILALLMVLGLAGNQVLHAQANDDQPYRPDYRYSGPQSAQISEDEASGKDPIMATMFALLPGVAIHGFGNYYAEDYTFGNHMLAMEILGGGLAWWGYGLIHQPDSWNHYFGDNGTTIQAGYWVKASGLALIVLSWVGDVATASDAAAQYNSEHDLHFKLEGEINTPRVTLCYNF